MAYGPLRFFDNNEITDGSMITPASQASGVVSGAKKTIGIASAIMAVTGTYTGLNDLFYTVQIDSTTPGTEIGQATFRWRTTATLSGSWEATGVTTSSSFLNLNYGVQIAWKVGTGQDVNEGDTWTFYATAVFGAAKLLSFDRNAIFRTGATFPFVIDLGSAQRITAFALLDHNLTSGGTLTLQANTSDSWGSPAYSQAVSNNNPAYLYLDQTYRYWRVVPVDVSLSYFQAGQLFLGTYLELSRINAAWGSVRGQNYILQKNISYTGLQRNKAYARQRTLDLDFPLLRKTDFEDLVSMQEALIDLTTGDVSPLFVHLFSDESDTLYWMEWTNIDNLQETLYRSGWMQTRMQFAEQPKTRI
jgi:hypothetical protein